MDHYFINNENLKSEIKKINYSYNEYGFSFFSDNGVFSKNHIDYGSRLLVETFLKNGTYKEKILDIGCGYGFIGITLAKVLKSDVTLADINKRALHLVKMNKDENKVNVNILESNIYDNATGKFDLIITNPPVRVGKDTLLNFLVNAKDYLNTDGELWYVLRKDQGAKSIEKTLKELYEIQIMEKSNGFYIFCCKNH